MIICTRRRILNVIAAHEKGITPPGVDDPDTYSTRSAQLLLPKGADWIEATQEVRKGSRATTTE
jgi:phthalate 4,5-dioxygenase